MYVNCLLSVRKQLKLDGLRDGKPVEAVSQHVVWCGRALWTRQ